MLELIPPTAGFHPLVVHFPIALLFMAPVFFVVAYAWRSKFEFFASVGGLLLVIGSALLILAVESGDEAREAVKKTDEIRQAIRDHSHLADTTRNIFLSITVIYIGFLGLRSFRPKFAKNFKSAMLLILLANLVGLGYLAKTSHAGGHLVHELGVHAPMTAASLPAAEGDPAGNKDDDD